MQRVGRTPISYRHRCVFIEGFAKRYVRGRRDGFVGASGASPQQQSQPRHDWRFTVASKYFHSAPHVNVPKYLYTALCMMFILNVSQDSLTYIIGLTTVNRPDAARRFAQSTLSRRRRNRHSQTYQIRATWLPLTKDTIAG